mmetsp:Transcript_1497/g.4042  ORF Transcript_1497/g.4042 Transcript_1497/m.4042 type:complete len:279 (+) Transcript_1497:647-1483(+)
MQHRLERVNSHTQLLTRRQHGLYAELGRNAAPRCRLVGGGEGLVACHANKGNINVEAPRHRLNDLRVDTLANLRATVGYDNSTVRQYGHKSTKRKSLEKHAVFHWDHRYASLHIPVARVEGRNFAEPFVELALHPHFLPDFGQAPVRQRLVVRRDVSATVEVSPLDVLRRHTQDLRHVLHHLLGEEHGGEEARCPHVRIAGQVGLATDSLRIEVVEIVGVIHGHHERRCGPVRTVHREAPVRVEHCFECVHAPVVIKAHAVVGQIRVAFADHLHVRLQ